MYQLILQWKQGLITADELTQALERINIHIVLAEKGNGEYKVVGYDYTNQLLVNLFLAIDIG